MLKTNISKELNLGIKYMGKGDRHLMKETKKAVNSLTISGQQACLYSVYLSRKYKRPKYNKKFNHEWKQYGVYNMTNFTILRGGRLAT